MLATGHTTDRHSPKSSERTRTTGVTTSPRVTERAPEELDESASWHHHACMRAWIRPSTPSGLQVVASGDTTSQSQVM